MNKEQSSAAYIQGKLRDHQEYLGCDEHRRKRLITCDLYTLEQAFEDGWDEAQKQLLDKAVLWLKENVHKYVINVSTEEEFRVTIGGRLWKRFREEIEE